jgi:hypothetical protein
MTIPTLHIENLHLRIPGLTPQAAQQLAMETVQRLAGRLPDRMTAQHLDELNVHLSVPAGTPRHQMAELILAAILKRIT